MIAHCEVYSTEKEQTEKLFQLHNKDLSEAKDISLSTVRESQISLSTVRESLVLNFKRVIQNHHAKRKSNSSLILI